MKNMYIYLYISDTTSWSTFLEVNVKSFSKTSVIFLWVVYKTGTFLKTSKVKSVIRMTKQL